MTDAVELNAETLIPVNPPAAAPVAPAPAPVAATPAPAPSATEEEGDATEELDAAGQPKKPIQPRINELVRKRHEAEREAAYWRGVATSGGAKPAQAPAAAPAPAPEPPRPVASNFQTYDEYVDALTDWKVEKALKPALAGVNKSIEERSATQTKAQQEAELQTNWQKRQDATKAVIKDYDEVVANSDLPIAKHVGDLLIESEHGPALAYKLAKDPALADKLNKMTPTAAAMHIGRLEAAFEPAADSPAQADAPAAAPAAPVKAVSKAPVPPTPVNTNSSRAPALQNMAMDDYVKARKAQGAGWAR